jgi:magnesium chelatase subunit D
MCLAEALPSAWDRALTALALLAVDPGLGGVALRARVGPVREAWSGMLEVLALPLVRLHPAMGDDVLYGGLDLSATLAAGHMVTGRGLLADPSALVLAMAERAGPGLAARLALVLDEGRGHCLVALDEGAAPDERLAPALEERLAFAVDLGETALGDVTGFPWDADEIAAARAARTEVALPDEVLAEVVAVMTAFGVDSGRAGTFALRAARAHAALNGRAVVTADDLETAAGLVLAHRATIVPEPADQEAAPEPPSPGEASAAGDDEELVLPEELLLEAVRAMLPDDLLDRLRAGKARSGRGEGSGAARKGNRRGRPLPSRAGRMGDGARVDVVATLRVAAPWQRLRTGSGVKVRSGDLRFRRFEEKSDRLLVFAVDASGSAALARLAEAKGAVELLLAQAYARRDHVALVAFRGTGAEVLLPPTRSLVQTKRRLAALPGGGGTPLAAGLRAALGLTDQARRRGLTPTVVVLTDGRANIALDGRADRAQAAADAQGMARALRAAGVDAIVIDTGNRPEPALKELARMMDGLWLPMPRADAQRLSGAVAAALD